MGADAASKAGKTSATQPAEASGSGTKKPRKQRRGPVAPPSSASEEGTKQPAGAEASAGGGEEPSGGHGAAGGVKTVTLKSAVEASEGAKGEQSKSQVKTKERTRDSKSTHGENKNKSGTKRSDQENPGGDAKGEKANKRGKRSDPSETTGKEAAADGGPPSTKRWSEEDVIRLLEGTVECQGEHGPDACFHLNLIHKHICETRRTMQFSRSQLYEKLRRLKQKYEATISQIKGGEIPAFAKPHDQAVFELSKRIWTVEEGIPQPLAVVDHEDNGGGAAKEEEALTLRAVGQYPDLKEVVSQLEKESVHYMGVGLLKKGFGLIQPSKAKALEERWKVNCLAGMKFLLEDSKLKSELLEACVEALDSHVP